MITDQYPGGIQFLYPNGPISLRTLFGQATEMDGTGNDIDHLDDRAWWLGLDNTSKYPFLEDSIIELAKCLDGTPVNGVIGFSQGAALGAMFAALCECNNNPAKAKLVQAQNLPVDAFQQLLPRQQSLKFFVGISGFRGTEEWYSSFYTPRLKTPSCHIVGEFDSMVSHRESEAFVRSFKTHEVYHHFGGHYIPRDEHITQGIVWFLQESCLGSLPKVAETVAQLKGSPSEYGGLFIAWTKQGNRAKSYLVSRRHRMTKVRVLKKGREHTFSRHTLSKCLSYTSSLSR